MRSIRAKITAITIAAIVVTIVAVFFAFSVTIQVESDRNSVEMMNLILQSTAKTLERYFESIEQSAEMTANIATDSLDSVVLVESGAIGPADREHPRTPEQHDALEAYLAEHCDTVQETLASVADHTQGIVSYYYFLNPELCGHEQSFFYTKIGKTGFNEQDIDVAMRLDPGDLEHDSWYYLSNQRGRPAWVGPYKAGYSDGMMICSYLVPVYKAGTLVSVLGMDLPVDTLVSQLSPIRVYQSGFAFLLDREGRVLYHPHIEMGVKPDSTALAVSGGELGGESSGSAPIRYYANGAQRQMSFTTLSNGMKLVVTAPVSEINASWVKLVRILLLITAAVIGSFLLVMMFWLRSLTRPLLNLTEAARRLANADYDAELDYRSQDEVGVLNDAFTRMRDRIKLYIEDLNRRIHTDSLTGVPNMRYFFELAEAERGRMRAEGRKPVLLYFNLIGLKHYNRQYGFTEGDKLICGFAGVLACHFGAQSLGRFGQDHFAVLSEEDGLDARIEQVFGDCRQLNGGLSLPVRVGVYRDELEQVDVSVACDRAKYACDRGRDTFVSGVQTFDSRMMDQLEDVRYIINHLDRALEEGWIETWYQPIVRASSGRVCDEEALARWNDPERGMLSPAVFIPVLEKAHLIYKLDLYMLDHMLAQMLERQKLGIPTVPVSLNVSREDFDSCDIVEEIRRRVDAAGVPHEMLTVEVTESSIGSDFDFMKQQIERFQQLGFPVWMDDFGSGYSSLDVLKDIHFDLLKFDMRFMHRFGEGEESKIILRELVHMAVALGIDTVCEGVETEDQAKFLREIGCSKLQGYYFSRPLSYDTVVDRFKQGIEKLSIEQRGEAKQGGIP